MPERSNNGVSIERIDDLSIVSLRLPRKSLESARDKLQLAPPLFVAGGDPRSLWLGPDRWLLVSSSATPESIIQDCNESLAGTLHNAVDYSAALAVFRILGSGARSLLASACGLDFRPEKFPPGTCCRTQLAHVAAIITSERPEQFDVYVDRSYETYLGEWLGESLSVIAAAGLG